ncbi:LuxR family transcriptional regulator [Kitasatospora sp. NPDC049285]|uniref:LuxR family transcriptional regulator n=1 Tax=Kitasatospora sp. NPDC049285 TaxID=3157096 RepID=UPI00343F01AB
MAGSKPGAGASCWNGGPGGVPALVGRADELRSGAAALEGGGLVLAGPRGVGRTRLARELVAAAQRRGAAVDRLVASATTTAVPLAAFAGLPGPAAGSAADRPPQTVGEAVLRLAERAEIGRRLLVVDDAHLLDHDSALVIRHAAAQEIAAVLLTVCTEEPAPEPVRALWRDETLPRIDLAPLPRDGLAALLADALGAPVDGDTLDRMHRLCDGDLVTLRELVHDAVRDGTLERCGAAWSWRGTVTPDSRLGELVTARLAGLDPATRTVLELLAHGETLGARLLQDLVPDADLVALEGRRLIRVDAADRRREVRLRRPLDAELLRAATPRLRADQICRTLIDAVRAKGARRATDPLAIAGWQLTVGDGGADVDPAFWLAAAQRELTGADPLRAERLARAAVRAAPDSLAAGLLLGETLGRQGRTAEAAQVLARLDPLVGSDTERVRLARARATAACWGRGEPAAAVAVLLAAERQVASADHRQELQALRAAVEYGAGRAPEAVAAAEEVLAAPSGPASRIRMHRTAVAALAVTGRIQQALTEGERCLALVNAHGDLPPDLPDGPEAAADLALAVAAALRAASRLAEARRLARQTYLETSHRGLRVTVGAAAQLLGLIALDAGRVIEARGWLEEAVTLLDSSERTGCAGLAWSTLARTLALTPDPEHRRPMAAEAAAAQEAAEQAEHPARRAWVLQVELGRAWVAAAHGRTADARRLALDTADTATAQGLHTIALTAAHDALRLGADRAARTRLEAAAALAAGPLADACLAHAAARDSGDGHRLDAVSRLFAALGARLLAAETATEAADAHRRQGSPARATASGSAAAGHLVACQGALSPVIAERTVATGLTPREHEVVRLAAAGRSNREIAELLGSSVRTVESHLAHAYGKLGITRRDQLVDLCG